MNVRKIWLRNSQRMIVNMVALREVEVSRMGEISGMTRDIGAVGVDACSGARSDFCVDRTSFERIWSDRVS